MARTASASKSRSAGRSASTKKSLAAELGSLALLGVVGYVFVSLYSEHALASHPAAGLSNACGDVGRWIAGGIWSYLGLAASYVFVAIVSAWALCAMFGVKIVGWGWRLSGALLLVMATADIEWFIRQNDPWFGDDYRTIFGSAYLSGGYWGYWLGFEMFSLFDSVGSLVVNTLAVVIAIVLVADVRVSPLVRLMFWRSGEAAISIGKRLPDVVDRVRDQVGTVREHIADRVAERAAAKEQAEKEARKAERAEQAEARRRQAAERTAEKERAAAEASRAASTASAKSGNDTPVSRGTASGSTTAKPAPRVGRGAGIVEDDGADDVAEDSEWEYEYETDEDGEYEYEYDDGEDSDDGYEYEDDDAEVDDDREVGTAVVAAETREDDAEPKPERKIVLASETAPQEINPLRFEETQLSLDGIYSFPPAEFLADPKRVDHAEGREELEEIAQRIESTLQSFKIEAHVKEVQRGPSITQYEVALAAGIKVQRIVGLSDDLAMALEARSVRVVAPIPGKSAVGIEVPNRKREIVCLKELLFSRHFVEADTAIPLMLGKDVAGEPIIADLASMPHLLIAGSTGSGKSVCINAIITSILMTRSPEELKMIMVDPKMVELSLFEDIPHLLTPVITDMKKAPAALDWVVRKMEQRYSLLANAEVRNIASFNELGKKKLYERLQPKVGHEDAELAPDHLPYIVVIIDELADMMMTASKEVETSITRLAQKSRAVGIHVILATQRPSVDVLTGLIKSNLPCRISFMVASKIDSRTILDRNGAEKLLGKGDMLYQAQGTSDLIRAQSTFISDKEIRKIVRFLKKESTQEFSKEIDAFIDGGGARAGSDDPAQQDDMFSDAVRIVLETQRGSVSLLQRRLGVGYTRASRLMDLMCEQNLVGPFKGSKAREVYTTLEEWEAAQQG